MGAPEVIEHSDFYIAEYPQVVFDSSGNATAVWRQTVLDECCVITNRYTAGTGWGTEVISDETLGGVYPSELDVDGSGNVIVVYYQTGNTLDDEIDAVRYVNGLGWLTPEVLDDRSTWQFHYYPDVAVSVSGDAVAIWNQRNDVNNFDVWVNQF